MHYEITEKTSGTHLPVATAVTAAGAKGTIYDSVVKHLGGHPDPTPGGDADQLDAKIKMIDELEPGAFTLIEFGNQSFGVRLTEQSPREIMTAAVVDSLTTARDNYIDRAGDAELSARGARLQAEAYADVGDANLAHYADQIAEANTSEAHRLRGLASTMQAMLDIAESSSFAELITDELERIQINNQAGA